MCGGWGGGGGGFGGVGGVEVMGVWFLTEKDGLEWEREDRAYPRFTSLLSPWAGKSWSQRLLACGSE